MEMRLTNNSKRTAMLPKVRITEQEREAVEKAAKEMGMNLADFIRFCVNEQLKEGK